MRKSKYLHEYCVLKNRFPLVLIDFARGTAEFGGAYLREKCLLGGRIFVWTKPRAAKGGFSDNCVDGSTS